MVVLTSWCPSRSWMVRMSWLAMSHFLLLLPFLAYVKGLTIRQYRNRRRITLAGRRAAVASRTWGEPGPVRAPREGRPVPRRERPGAPEPPAGRLRGAAFP